MLTRPHFRHRVISTKKCAMILNKVYISKVRVIYTCRLKKKSLYNHNFFPMNLSGSYINIKSACKYEFLKKLKMNLDLWFKGQSHGYQWNIYPFDQILCCLFLSSLVLVLPEKVRVVLWIYTIFLMNGYAKCFLILHLQ